MKKYVIFLFIWFSVGAYSQIKITFQSTDSIEVTADYYRVGLSKPFVVMFHDTGGSRGEYREIAQRFVKLGYNCLAVDLRYGDEYNFITNETHLAAKRAGKSISEWESHRDVIAAINYAYSMNKQPVIVMGSSFSASLALYYSINNAKVDAVVALNPGEFFTERFTLTTMLKKYDKHVFAASRKSEFDYLKDLFQYVPSSHKLLFAPSNAESPLRLKSLMQDEEGNDELWLTLLMYFKGL